MPYQAVMFDLDGTLADTLADIAASANHALEQLGRPTFATDRYRYLAGQGLKWLMTQALGPEHEELTPQAMSLFHVHYALHSLDRTCPYPGVAEMLEALSARKIPMAVLSNKPEAATVEVVTQILGRWRFDAVVGQREGVPLKPDPTAALAIARSLGIAPQQWLYVGDTRVDMLTARAAGMFPVGVLWGFRDEEELRQSGATAIITHPGELPALLD